MRARLAALIALTAVLCASMPASAQSYDVLIRNGRVLDGSGNPYFRADIGIRGDEIVAVGDLPGATADRVVDAAGKYVTPGFIALHELVGKTLAEVSAERGETPFETAIWLRMNGFDRPGGVLWMAQAVGTEDIVVNGEFAVDDGAPTDALTGEVLRRPGSKAAA
ncbi:hypothetical protein [Candidatus Palauibacter sp.]|uniref:hypothetical protein n=1 Tax=Candidatus Palauibacter sp. TaxID=3101350 RepID=UPI003AF1ED55